LDGDLWFGLVYIFTLRHWSGAWYDDKQRAKRYTRQRILLIGLELGLERLRWYDLHMKRGPWWFFCANVKPLLSQAVCVERPGLRRHMFGLLLSGSVRAEIFASLGSRGPFESCWIGGQTGTCTRMTCSYALTYEG
jgi:hypothetical protein